MRRQKVAFRILKLQSLNSYKWGGHRRSWQAPLFSDVQSGDFPGFFDGLDADPCFVLVAPLVGMSPVIDGARDSPETLKGEFMPIGRRADLNGVPRAERLALWLARRPAPP